MLCWLGVWASLWVVWVLRVCAVRSLRFLTGCGAWVWVGGGRMGVRVGLWSVCDGWLLVDGAGWYGVWVGVWGGLPVMIYPHGVIGPCGHSLTMASRHIGPHVSKNNLAKALMSTPSIGSRVWLRLHLGFRRLKISFPLLRTPSNVLDVPSFSSVFHVCPENLARKTTSHRRRAGVDT